MKKGFLSLIFCLMLCVTVFTGCTLVERDNYKYYNQVIATVELDGYHETVTKREVMSMFETTYNYMQSYQMTAQQALEKTVDDVVDYKLRLIRAKQNVQLDDKDVNHIISDIYDNMYSQLEGLEDTIRQEWGIEVNDQTTSTTNTSLNKTEFTEYNHTIELVDGQLVRKEEEETKDYSKKPEFTYETLAELQQEAYNRFLRSVQTNAEAEGVILKSDKDIFDYEYNRLYKVYEDGMYIEKYQDKYQEGLAINTELVVKQFADTYLDNYYDYNLNIEGEDYQTAIDNVLKAYRTQMAQDATSVYYHPNSDGADSNVEYVNVIHILLKFTDEQRAELINAKNELDAGVYNSDEDYNTEYKRLTSPDRAMFEVKVLKEDGTVGTEKKSANQLYEEIYNAVNGKESLADKAKTFRQLMFKYSDDSGLTNSSNSNYNFGYVVNLKDHDQAAMVTEFTKASQELYQANADGGNMSGLVFHDGEYPTGTNSDTGYTGFHIILNLGAVRNRFDYDYVNSGKVTWQDLWNIETMPGSGVTLFEQLYQNIDYDSTLLSTHVSELIDNARNAANITTYKYRLKDLYR